MENLCIEERKKLSITGATKVISSTSTQAVVEVGEMSVVISGTNIEVVKLDLDNKQVNFSGTFSGIKYVTKTEKTPILKRLFK